MPASKTPTIRTVEEFLRWTQKFTGGKMLYRGLAKAAWTVQASAYRRILTSQNKKSVSPAVFREYIEQLLDQARTQGFHHRDNRALYNLELLAQLQHNKAATCLIDFTENPLVALWFACEEKEEADGKVVALATGDIGEFNEVNSSAIESDRTIAEFLGPDKPWWKWRPEQLGNRITAQHSCFVLGPGEIPDKLCHVVEIDRQEKANIREELAALDISERRLFSDFAGFCEANAHERAYTGPAPAEEYMQLGIDSYHAGEFQRAVACYDRAIERGLNTTAVYLKRGAAKGASGDLQGAIADFGIVLGIEPDNAEAYNYRGFAKSELGDLEGALSDLDEAIGLDPNYADAYENRGVVKEALGDEAGAQQDDATAGRLSPEPSAPVV